MVGMKTPGFGWLNLKGLKMNKIYNKWLGRKYKFKEWFFENITPHLPKIQVRKPEYFGFPLCVDCHTLVKVYAIHTGDSWLFHWDCECGEIAGMLGDRSFIVGYFPFLFGWASGKDLARIGIEER